MHALILVRALPNHARQYCLSRAGCQTPELDRLIARPPEPSMTIRATLTRQSELVPRPGLTRGLLRASRSEVDGN
jgi:hypothetical protein